MLVQFKQDVSDLSVTQTDFAESPFLFGVYVQGMKTILVAFILMSVVTITALPMLL